jgi:hypothetical protein
MGADDMMLEQVLDLGESLAALVGAMFGDPGPAPEEAGPAAAAPADAGTDEMPSAA